MAVHVLCVRHGLSTWNLERRWQGRADPPLSDEGRSGAAELADALAATVGPRVRVWSSHLRRAAATAAIIVERLDARPVTIDPRLGEADIGPWVGLTTVEIEAGWPGYLADGRRPDGFESEITLLSRVLPALDDVARASEPGVVPIVIAHAGVLRAVRRYAGAVDEHLANLGGLWFAIGPAAGAVTLTGIFEPGHRAAGPDETRL